MLLAAGADAAARDDAFRATPRAFGICVPASWGLLPKLKRRLAEDPSLVNINDARAAPLHEAARAGNVGALRVLLDAHADPHATDVDGLTPLDLAREQEHEEAASMLADVMREKPAPPAKPRTAKRAPMKKVQWKPIMDAAYAGDAQGVRAALDAGADPDVLSPTNHRHRPLHRAIERKKSFPRNEGHEAVVRLLLERGADPKLRGTHGGHTALQLAAIDSPRFVPLLVDRFRPFDVFHAVVTADVSRVTALLKRERSLAVSRDGNNWTPLHYCAASSAYRAGAAGASAQAKVAALLLEAGADVSATYDYESKWPIPPLFYCCGYHDNPALTEQLLRAGANPCDQESVYHASDEGHARCLDLFDRYVEKQKLADECTRCLATQLHWGHVRGAAWLLAHGADPNVLDPNYGDGALHAAVRQGKSESVVALMLAHGGDPAAKNREGKSALQLAKASGKAKLVAVLSGGSVRKPGRANV